MTTDDVLALTPGPQLDEAIHLFVFSNLGKCRPYSTKNADAARLIDRLPLFVGRVPVNHPKFDASRPYVAGTLAHEPSVQGDVTRLRVTAPTLMVALCKAALLVVLRPAKAERAAPPSPENQAREIAARIGTPAARNPNAPAPGGIQQPRARVQARNQRAPMPKRPERFIGPDPRNA